MATPGTGGGDTTSMEIMRRPQADTRGNQPPASDLDAADFGSPEDEDAEVIEWAKQVVGREESLASVEDLSRAAQEKGYDSLSEMRTYEAAEQKIRDLEASDAEDKQELIAEAREEALALLSPEDAATPEKKEVDPIQAKVEAARAEYLEDIAALTPGQFDGMIAAAEESLRRAELTAKYSRTARESGRKEIAAAMLKDLRSAQEKMDTELSTPAAEEGMEDAEVVERTFDLAPHLEEMRQEEAEEAKEMSAEELAEQINIAQLQLAKAVNKNAQGSRAEYTRAVLQDLMVEQRSRDQEPSEFVQKEVYKEAGAEAPAEVEEVLEPAQEIEMPTVTNKPTLVEPKIRKTPRSAMGGASYKPQGMTQRKPRPTRGKRSDDTTFIRREVTPKPEPRVETPQSEPEVAAEAPENPNEAVYKQWQKFLVSRGAIGPDGVMKGTIQHEGRDIQVQDYLRGVAGMDQRHIMEMAGYFQRRYREAAARVKERSSLEAMVLSPEQKKQMIEKLSGRLERARREEATRRRQGMDVAGVQERIKDLDRQVQQARQLFGSDT